VREGVSGRDVGGWWLVAYGILFMAGGHVVCSRAAPGLVEWVTVMVEQRRLRMLEQGVPDGFRVGSASSSWWTPADEGRWSVAGGRRQ
jgi:hypothetical protein